MRITIVNAGMSEHASTARLGRLLEDEILALRPDIKIAWVHLRPLAHDITDHLLTGFAPPALTAAQGEVRSADGVLALSPTYQGSYSGLFKAFFDTLGEDSLAGIPVVIGATGGTPRHALVTENALRPLMIHMHAEPVPTAVYAATEDWCAHAYDSTGDGGHALARRVGRAARQLVGALPPTEHRGTEVGVTSSAPTTDEVHATTAEGSTIRDATADWPGFVDFEKLLEGVK